MRTPQASMIAQTQHILSTGSCHKENTSRTDQHRRVLQQTSSFLQVKPLGKLS